MNIKFRLTLLSFLQFFVWGAWLITIANYWFGTKQWDGTKFGAVFSTMGIASVFMPTLVGIIADRWINAERIYGILHILYAAVLFYLPQVTTPDTFFVVMLLAMVFYMPTIALANSISYTLLKNNNYDVVKDFPPIRVWGTIGFIVAMWITNLSGNKASEFQFYIAGAAAVLLGLYSFALPACKPQKLISKDSSLVEVLGLNAFKLFGNYKMALFFIFSMFLGGALQLTNAYGDVFLSEFENFPKYADSFVVKYSTIIMSISQVSETLFILAIPFFLRKYGIKNVMLMSMFAWVLRFGLFSFGNPTSGLWMIILSCIIYGMAFDFFNISGSLFVETNTNSKIRSSAQGLFMMMTNGFGAIIGSVSAGWAIDKFFTQKFSTADSLAGFLDTTVDNSKFVEFIGKQGSSIVNGTLTKEIAMKDWPHIWLAFAAYALVIAVLFALMFKHKHNPEAIGNVSH
ncbi:nucleoside permease [Cloacibacterium normanense]|jgi:NHS family xanthosine MFS transporter|uniref:nucleoside permease n=1 Tax=Cloacibacterium normanense TaxID=237258 RepID=UPI00352C6AC4